MSNIKDSITTQDEVGITITRGNKEDKKPDYRQKDLNEVAIKEVTYAKNKECND